MTTVDDLTDDQLKTFRAILELPFGAPMPEGCSSLVIDTKAIVSVIDELQRRRAADAAWGIALLGKYDWEGATPAPGLMRRLQDLPRFSCMRCGRSLGWEPAKTPCSHCEPARGLLRAAIGMEH